jgi:imidazolonepropionase
VASARAYDTLWINARLATMTAGGAPYGAIADGALGDGAIAARDGAIAWVGARAELADAPERLAARVIDAGGRWITPGLVDPHTHLVFGGDRVGDFERRVAGQSYVAAAVSGGSGVPGGAAGGGGGIAHTVAMTRACDEATLFRDAARRLRTMMANGTTTVEIKSGYGLDVDTELRVLRVARRLGSELGISVRTTYLGAHVVPPEYAERRGDYLALVCDVMLPRIAREGLADAVDVFCDTIAFSVEESARVLDAARRLGLAVKLHADQIADTGAAALAARYGALSADHIEHTNEDGVAALARAGTVAVLLPGAYHYLRETVKPPVAALRAHGVPIALATDCNPGTSPVLSLPTVMNLACVLFGLTPEESVAGATRNAARALGLTDRGELRTGARCDLALWAASSPAELCYWLGASPCAGVVIAGEPG